jgi:hypothetical protein
MALPIASKQTAAAQLQHRTSLTSTFVQQALVADIGGRHRVVTVAVRRLFSNNKEGLIRCVE